jgi:hypothetical protein
LEDEFHLTLRETMRSLGEYGVFPHFFQEGEVGVKNMRRCFIEEVGDSLLLLCGEGIWE